MADSPKPILARLRDRLAALRAGSGPMHTLLFVTPEETYRLDGDGNGLALGEVATLPFGDADLATLADTVARTLDGSARPGRKLWVMHAGLTLHVLSLPTAQVADIDATLLAQTLRFELDDHGVAVPADASLAHRLTGSDGTLNGYALVQGPTGAIEALGRAAAKHRTALAGLFHPGGLPMPLRPGPDPWMRLETWPNAVVGVGRDARKQFAWTVIRANPHGPQFQRELSRWRKTLSEPYHEDSLGWTPPEPGPDAPEPFRSGHWLAWPEHRQTWLSGWLAELAAGEEEGHAAAPMLRPPERSLPEPVLMAGAGALALLICLGHYGLHWVQASSARTETERLKKADADLKAQQSAIVAAEDERDRLKKIAQLQRENQNSLPRVVRALKQRPAGLLHEVAAHRPDQVVVERIAPTKDGAEIEGVTLETYQVDELAERLAAPLAALGLEVKPPELEDLKTFSGGGPWRFVLRLTDHGLAGFVKPDTPTAP